MKLRTKFLLAFFLLALLPLGYIVLHSYETSIAAFRAAVQAESRTMAEEMNQRMDTVRANLDSTLSRATELRLVQLEDEQRLKRAEELAEIERINRELAEVAPMVEACEFVPALPCPDEAPAPPAEGAPPAQHQDTPGRIVFNVNWLRLNGDDADSVGVGTVVEDEEAIPTKNSPEPPPWMQELLAEGGKLVEAIAEDPDRAEEIIAAQGSDFGAHVLDEVAKRSPELIARAIEHPDELEESLNQHGALLLRIIREAVPAEIRLSATELEQLEAKRAEAEQLLGRSYSYELRDGEQLLGTMHAQIRANEVFEAVLETSRREAGEIPYAVDAEGRLYTLDDEDEEMMSELRSLREEQSSQESFRSDWVLAETTDAVSGTTFGIARPLGEGLDEIRRTAVRNMALGMLVVAVAGVVVLPLSRRMTRHLGTLNDAAESLARGELETRVHLRSRDEIGALAASFNTMAEELQQQRSRLLDEERLRREQEVETRLLELENRRQNDELEAARQFQLSLLPRRLPKRSGCALAVAMHTATEVGGDYYDFRRSDDDELVLALGDATGHGAAAGTMVTVAKSLFTAADEVRPGPFLDRAAEVIRTMRLGRMTMALAVARLNEDGLELANAGMPPVLVHRAADDTVEEFLIPGVPLGGYKDTSYRSRQIPLAAGDTVLMMSDGFPELLNDEDYPLGYERARRHFAELAGLPPEELIAGLETRAREWRGERAQADDMTFLVIRCSGK